MTSSSLPPTRPRSWEIGPCGYCDRITDSPEVPLNDPDALVCDNCGERLETVQVVALPDLLETLRTDGRDYAADFISRLYLKRASDG